MLALILASVINQGEGLGEKGVSPDAKLGYTPSL
jgi:hypothetical protein